jgi:hypothetical protein
MLHCAETLHCAENRRTSFLRTTGHNKGTGALHGDGFQSDQTLSPVRSGDEDRLNLTGRELTGQCNLFDSS